MNDDRDSLWWTIVKYYGAPGFCRSENTQLWRNKWIDTFIKRWWWVFYACLVVAFFSFLFGSGAGLEFFSTLALLPGGYACYLVYRKRKLVNETQSL